MKKWLPWILLSCLALAALPAAAQGAVPRNLVVSYLDGTARVKSGTAWTALAIGDLVPIDSSVRLEGKGCIQLTAAGIDFILTRAGSYAVKDIVAMRQTVAPRGIASLLAASLRLLTVGRPPQNAAFGARAGNTGGTEEDAWAESSASVFLAAGKEYMKSARYAAAVEQLEEARANATDDELPEIRYYLASAHALSGNLGEAWSQVDGVKPPAGAAWAGDFLLLKARLLIDTSAFADAGSLLTGEGASLAQDASRAPLYYFLLGVAFRGTGSTEEARRALSRVVTLAPDSDLGNAAKELLNAP